MLDTGRYMQIIKRGSHHLALSFSCSRFCYSTFFIKTRPNLINSLLRVAA